MTTINPGRAHHYDTPRGRVSVDDPLDDATLERLVTILTAHDITTAHVTSVELHDDGSSITTGRPAGDPICPTCGSLIDTTWTRFAAGSTLTTNRCDCRTEEDQ